MTNCVFIDKMRRCIPQYLLIYEKPRFYWIDDPGHNLFPCECAGSSSYWDANVDIANRRIQCDYFSFNAETAVFVKGEDRIGAPISNSSAIRTFNTQYSHPPLPNEITPPVNIGLVVLSDGRNLDRHNSPPFWTVIDGRYHGPASISEYVEIVAFNASTENAVRSWLQDGSVPAYNVCYANTDRYSWLRQHTIGRLA